MATIDFKQFDYPAKRYLIHIFTTHYENNSVSTSIKRKMFENQRLFSFKSTSFEWRLFNPIQDEGKQKPPNLTNFPLLLLQK